MNNHRTEIGDKRVARGALRSVGVGAAHKWRLLLPGERQATAAPTRNSDKGRRRSGLGFGVQQRSVLLIELSADAPFAGETQAVRHPGSQDEY